VVEAFKDKVNSSVQVSFDSTSPSVHFELTGGGGAGLGSVDDVCGDGNLLSPKINSDTTP
jgi:hypothetical protein